MLFGQLLIYSKGVKDEIRANKRKQIGKIKAGLSPMGSKIHKAEAIELINSLTPRDPAAWQYKWIKPGFRGTKFLEQQVEQPEGGWKDHKETPLFELDKHKDE